MAEGGNKSRTLIISGSPRKKGRSAKVVEVLLEQRPQDEIYQIFSLAEHQVLPCTACNACKNTGDCCIDDDMQALYAWLEAADKLIVVSPGYFAGPPAQLKAVFDRLQAYFWEYMEERASKQASPGDPSRTRKRPAELYVLGDGGDPHGFEPLRTIAQSALAIAGFSLDAVHDLVGLNKEELAAKLSKEFSGKAIENAPGNQREKPNHG